MADVFISYSHVDKGAAKIIAEHLIEEGYDVWWDKDLIAGDDYTTMIEELLDSAKAVIVLWSGKSRASHWVRDEAAVGRDRNRLLPISIDGSLPPLGFRQIHTVALKGWDGKDKGVLEDIWLGLEGLVGRTASGHVEEDAPIEGETNPFGAPLEAAADIKRSTIAAGINAQPNNKSVAQILKEEKKQRSFLSTFWITSFIISGVAAVILGALAHFSDMYDETLGDVENLVLNTILAFLFTGLGLVIGRSLIVAGRRLAKRKSTFYFDSPTRWVMGITLVVTALFAWAGSTEFDGTDAMAAGDIAFYTPLIGFLVLFPFCALISVPIGFFKGLNRKTFSKTQAQS